MPARLNRRRYREVVATLKELVSDPKATRSQRLRAVETLLSVFDRADKSEAVRQARRSPVEAPHEAGQPEASPEPPKAPGAAVDDFLARITARAASEEQASA